MILSIRRVIQWIACLLLTGGLSLGLVCAFLSKDIAEPGKEIKAGLIFGMILGLLLLAMAKQIPDLPSPSLSKKLGVLFFAGFTNALGFGLSESLGVGLGERLDRTLVDIGLLGAVGGFWLVVLSIDSLPVVRYLMRPRVSVPTSSILFIGLMAIVSRVPLSSTGTVINSLGVAMVLPLGCCVGVVVGKSTVPIWTIVIRETKKPLKDVRLLWRPLTAFVFIYLILILLFAAAYSTLYHHNGSQQFAFPGRETGAILRFADFAYFSLVTITTVGYGDIYPMHGLARVLVAIEVLVGIAWVVVYFALMMKYLDTQFDAKKAP